MIMAPMFLSVNYFNCNLPFLRCFFSSQVIFCVIIACSSGLYSNNKLMSTSVELSLAYIWKLTFLTCKIFAIKPKVVNFTCKFSICEIETGGLV